MLDCSRKEGGVRVMCCNSCRFHWFSVVNESDLTGSTLLCSRRHIQGYLDVSGSPWSLHGQMKTGTAFPRRQPMDALRGKCPLIIFFFFFTISANVTVHEKTRYKLEIAILNSAHLEVQTLCYVMLKSDLSNRDEITSVWDDALLFSACYSIPFLYFFKIWYW